MDRTNALHHQEKIPAGTAALADVEISASAPPAAAAADADELLLRPPVFQVWLAEDRLAVLVDCPDPHADLLVAGARVETELEALGVADIPDADTLAERLAAACAPGEHLRGYPVVAGQAPVPPEDGRIKWTDDFFATGFAVDEQTGAVDYWERVDRRAVVADQVLARALEPRPGVPGRDVLGDAITVREPARVRLRTGKNVREESVEGALHYVAELAGRLRYQDDTLSVDEVYVIRGDVSLETGHVRHTGAVSVEGDVHTGARLEADGDVIVRGMMEPCSVICGGNLVVGGGIQGGPDHEIRTQGGVQARYIHEARVTAGGDVVVSSEVSHAVIRTAGRVLVAGGRLTGGSTVAHRGIKVARAGADGSTSTEIVAGVDPFLDARLREHSERLAKLEDARLRIGDVLLAAAQRGRRLSSQEQQTAAGLQEKLRQIEAASQQISRHIQRARRDAAMAGLAKIVILKEIRAGCVLGLGDARLRVTEDIDKPRIAELKRARVRLLPLGDGNLPEDL
ncbi:MAG: FapA family protein [Candidatus Krumholzibacteriia bacterium]